MKFEFATAVRILFGPGVSGLAGAEAAGFGRRAFVLTGSRPERASGILRQLHDHHVAYAGFAVGAEPTTELLRGAVEQARSFGAELVIGVGGGSVIDSGKVVAAMLANSGEILDYLEVVGSGLSLARMPAPYLAVPTTAGTGAEVTRNAVLGSPAHRVKVSMRGIFMLPRLALVDPELTASMPPALTAATGLDALTQLIEAFLSLRANPVTDGICREGLARAAEALPAAYADGGDRKAREDMSIASLFGGLALANSGLGAVHGLAGPFGGMFHAPHGAVCGRLLPFVLEQNLRALARRSAASPVLGRFTEAARILTGNADARAEDGLEWVRTLCAKLSIAPLAAYGFRDDHAPELIAKAMQASSMRGNPVALEAPELGAILAAAM